MLMKWLATVFACLLASSAFAEEHLVQKLATVNECAEWKTVNRILMETYGEAPFVIADGVIRAVIPGEIQKTKHRMLIYFNQETTTFSIVSLFVEEDMACIINSGNNFRPIVLQDGVNL